VSEVGVHQEYEQFSRVIDEYLMAEIDTSVNYEGDLISSKKMPHAEQEEEKLMLVSEDDTYFEVNTALQV